MANEIQSILTTYNRKSVAYPAAEKLDYPNADLYDDQIAVWTDYFNKTLKMNPAIDPDVVKTLLATESGFRIDPKENKKAFGIAQITPATLKIVQDSFGEVKEFIFKGIRQKDLKDPNIAIPISIRWLAKKQQMATEKLKRNPTHEEIILEYKGWLKGGSPLRDNALNKYRKEYAKIKSK